MAAAAARAEQLDSIADQLANAESPGYKASRPAFQSFLPPRAPGVSDKVYTAAVATGTDLSPGPVVTTDNPLDLVPGGASFLAVASATGQMVYTRNGKLTVDAQGVLAADGHAVYGTSGKPIVVPPGARVAIADNGEVSADGVTLDRLALFQFQGNVVRVGPQLYAPGPGGAVAAVEAHVTTGQLEMGNVTPLDSTVAMISAQRQFETAMQAIQTYRQLDSRATDVGKIR
jgi:flagellar basal-body rod protein FlgF